MFHKYICTTKIQTLSYIMKQYLLLLLCILPFASYAQQSQTIEMTPQEIEAVFLKENLELIAEKMNIDIADADIIQAKLWENPEISISSVNLWNTKNQREEIADMSSPLFGAFGKNTEFSIELSQLIQTANKRSKLVNREKVSKEIAIEEFEEVLRGLKVELRKTITETLYYQAYLKVLNNQAESLNQLISAYQKQVNLGNISKNELLRLQSSLLELDNDINEAQEDYNGHLKDLKTLLNARPETMIEIIGGEVNPINPDHLSLADLIATAYENRPDIRTQKLQTKYHEKSLSYEKSLRVPDITVSAEYDRYGGIWKDFVGFGVSFELPFLNRNQGGIKAARISRDQSQYLTRQQQNVAQHEIGEALNNYIQAYKFYTKIENNELISELDKMLAAYTKNLLSRNVSMLEYIDFMEAYRTNKEIILSSKKKVALSFEELQYTTGSEIK